MLLAGMMAADETALICDLAQTYGMLDWRSLSIPLLAALAAGLGEESRIKRKMAGIQIPVETMLLAGILDRLSILCWQQTENGRKGVDAPPSIFSILTAEPGTEDTESFDTWEEFMAARQAIMEG